MLVHLYLRNETVYLPTTAQTEAGYYMDVEPVSVVPAFDSQALQHAIVKTACNGNPIIPTPTRAVFPKPVLLSYAKIKSWPTFEKSASIWTIEGEDGSYQIKPGRRRPDKGWEDDPDQIESLQGVNINVVAQRVVVLVKIAWENTK